MASAYDPRSYFGALGYQAGDQPYTCPGLRTVSVYCRGDRAQLEALVRPTPFKLIGDWFVVSIADFSNCSMGPYFDAGVLVPVRYGDHVGAHYCLEWEDQSWSVALGRELWGYPKQFAEISLTETGDGVEGRVWLRDESYVDLSVTWEQADSADRGSRVWDDLALFPHLQVRASGQPDGPSFDRFDIISRDTSKDFELLESRCGTADVKFGDAVSVDGAQLTARGVYGAEFTIANYAATVENGIPSVIDSLV